MKLNPPILEIPDDTPYRDDLFNLQQFGDSLSSLFTKIDESIVLCVDAFWGEGKTTFARMWMADLRRQGIHCIYFDAYEHDYSDDPFVSFCAEIISLAETEFADSDAIQELKEDFKTKAKRIGGKLLCTGTRIGVKALTLGIFKDSDFDALNNIRGDIADSSSSAVSSFVEKAFDDYVSSKNSLTEFRDKLSALGAAVRAEQKFPLLIVVDELDRCRPDFALSLIERIKHLFSTNDVSFVLLTNMQQLQNYVETVYGTKVDAINYLHKFFTISTDLPQNCHDNHENNYSKYSHRLVKHYGLDSQKCLNPVLLRLFQHYRFSLREMERCFSMLVLYYSQLQENHLSQNEVISFLVILRLRFPDVFTNLAADNLSYDELVKATCVDKIESSDYPSFSKDHFLDDLKFLLLADEEYKALDERKHFSDSKRWLTSYHINRTKVMAFFCSELSRFKVEDS